jgi:hypothetical protein
MQEMEKGTEKFYVPIRLSADRNEKQENCQVISPEIQLILPELNNEVRQQQDQ